MFPGGAGERASAVNFEKNRHRGNGKAGESFFISFFLRLAIPSPDYVHRETERAEPARAVGFLRFSWRFHLERKNTHEKSGTRIQNQQ